MANNNQQPKLPTSQLIFPNAEATNANQIQNLLQIGSFALHAMIRPDGNNSAIPGNRPDFPKEAEIAAENTFIKVLDTFDSMLADRDRWSLDTQKKMAERFDEAHSLNLKYLEHQAESMRIMTTPHFRFRPDVKRLKDGRFLAILGHVEDLDNAICGVGATLEGAMEDFDNTCAKGVCETIAAYMQKREADLAAGQKPEQYPKAPAAPEKTETKKRKTK
jgi:hypothetical protein